MHRLLFLFLSFHNCTHKLKRVLKLSLIPTPYINWLSHSPLIKSSSFHALNRYCRLSFFSPPHLPSTRSPLLWESQSNFEIELVFHLFPFFNTEIKVRIVFQERGEYSRSTSARQSRLFLPRCNNRKISRIATTPVFIPNLSSSVPRKPWKTFSLSISFEILSQPSSLTRDAFNHRPERYLENTCYHVPPRFNAPPFPNVGNFPDAAHPPKFAMKFVMQRCIYPIYDSIPISSGEEGQ